MSCKKHFQTACRNIKTCYFSYETSTGEEQESVKFNRFLVSRVTVSMSLTFHGFSFRSRTTQNSYTQITLHTKPSYSLPAQTFFRLLLKKKKRKEKPQRQMRQCLLAKPPYSPSLQFHTLQSGFLHYPDHKSPIVWASCHSICQAINSQSMPFYFIGKRSKGSCFTHKIAKVEQEDHAQRRRLKYVTLLSSLSAVTSGKGRVVFIKSIDKRRMKYNNKRLD